MAVLLIVAGAVVGLPAYSTGHLRLAVIGALLLGLGLGVGFEHIRYEAAAVGRGFIAELRAARYALGLIAVGVIVGVIAAAFLAGHHHVPSSTTQP